MISGGVQSDCNECMRNYSPSYLSSLARRLFVNGPLLIRSLQRFRPFICPFDELIARVPHESRVLDVGCGGGLFLGLLQVTRGITYGHGFDSSVEAITVAQCMADCLERPCSSARTLFFEHRSVTDPWPDGPFDVVSIIDVMHHVQSPAQRRLLELAIRRVKPGGLLLYKDMVRRPLWRATANRLHDLLIARERIHYVPIAEIERWATDAGLEMVETVTINRLWYGHELSVFKRPHSKTQSS